MSKERTGSRLRAVRHRWYVLDPAGRVVSIGYDRRGHAQGELEVLRTALRQELQELGHSCEYVNDRLAGFSIGHTREPVPGWKVPGGSRSEHRAIVALIAERDGA